MEAENVKELVAEYYKLQRMTRKMVSLRKSIIDKLKKNGMTGTAFRFHDSTIKYSTYYRYSDINKEHVREILTSYYPGINTEEFIKRLWDGRQRTRVETIRTYGKTQMQEED